MPDNEELDLRDPEIDAKIAGYENATVRPTPEQMTTTLLASLLADLSPADQVDAYIVGDALMIQYAEADATLMLGKGPALHPSRYAAGEWGSLEGMMVYTDLNHLAEFKLLPAARVHVVAGNGLTAV